ncbi:MAG: putative peptidoglycan glycosyltransferase FtsW [Litorilinea sp.]
MATKSLTTKSLTARRQADDRAGSYDWGLITVVTTLLFFGLVIVFSASFAIGLEMDSPYYFAGRQLMYMTLGVVVMVVLARIPYTVWRTWAIPIMAVTLLLLLAVLIFGTDTHNARRTFFGGRIQPGEAAKLGVVIYAAAWLTSKGDRIRRVQVGLLPFSFLLGIVGMLLYFQPSLSTAILIIATAFIMFFIAGAAIHQLFIILAGGIATFWLVFEYSPLAAHARSRIDLYIQAIWNPLESDQWQVWQAIQALMRGGAFGTGVGEGIAKLPGYLPFTWQDNIFALIGEEMGLMGALFIVLLFTLFAYFGLRTALRAPDNFGAILATGITTLITLQAVLHMAVTVSITPPTGQPLPLISYGGSSLVTMLAAVGILLSISRGLTTAPAAASAATDSTGRQTVSGKTQHARFDFGWRDWGSRLSGTGSRRTFDSTAPTSTFGTTGTTRSGYAGRQPRAAQGFIARIFGQRRPTRRK